jgi:hypothetical protein
LKVTSTTKVAVAAILIVAALGFAGGSLLPHHGTEQSVSAAAPPNVRLPPIEARQPPPEPPSEQQEDPLRRHLRQWQKEAQQARSLSIQVKRFVKDKVFHDDNTFVGTALLLGSDHGMLELRREGKPQDFEKLVYVGNSLYLYSANQKEVHQLTMPANKPWPAPPHLLPPGLFRARTADVERDFALRLVKEDQWYVYVEFTPRRRTEQQGGLLKWTPCNRGRLVLNKANYLPRQLWMDWGHSETTWDFVRVEVGGRIDRKAFEPRVPRGWKMVRVPTGWKEVFGQ